MEQKQVGVVVGDRMWAPKKVGIPMHGMDGLALLGMHASHDEEGGERRQVSKSDMPVSEKLTFIDCAHKVLEVFANKKPMHYRDITQKALAMGWLITNGKTPKATMMTQILTEIDRQRKQGKTPRFVQHGRGYIGLSHWMGRGLTFQIEQHNQKVRQTLLKKLLAMAPAAFEELISQLLVEMGFEKVEVTKVNGDGGIDVRGVLVVGTVIRIRMAVQVKRWSAKNNVHVPIVQQVRGSLGVHEQGLIITTSDFSPGAIQEAEQPDKTPIALMNGEQLIMLLLKHGFGVHRSTPDLFEIDEQFAC